MKKILFLVTLAGSLVGLAKTPGELARENRALVEKYGKSVATVRYYVKKNADGIEPKFEIPYQCPNCKNTHWRDEGVSADDGIPAEFAGYVIGRDEVVIQDVMVAPEFVDRIEVTCAGETVAAQEVAACPAENALVLRTAKPLSAAVPLAFTGGGEPEDPRYFYLVKENGETVASVSGSEAGKFVHHVEAGKDVYEGKPNTLVLDKDGNPVTVAYQLQVELGKETFTPPTAWRREPADARFARKRAFEDRLRKAVLPAYVQLEAPAKEDGPSRRFSFSDDEAKGNDIDTCLVLVENAAFLMLKLGPQETARLVKIEATLPDGKKVPLAFAGSHAAFGAMAVTFKEGRPAGLEPLTLDRRPAIAHFGRRIRTAGAVNKGGTLEIKSGEQTVREFERGKGNVTQIDLGRQWLGVALGEDESDLLNKHGLSFSEAGLVGLQLADRRASSSWDSVKSVQADELVALVEKPVFDGENVPRSAADRKRAPWLGVEVQAAGPDILREKKATSYFRDYDFERAALVTAVASDSPAAKLGIKEGDILLSAKYPGGREEKLVLERDYFSGIDWNEVFDDPRFLEMGGTAELTPWPNAAGGVNAVLAAKFSVGAEVVIAWVSDGRRKEGACALGLAPVSYASAPRSRNRELGLTVCDMTQEVRKYFKFDEKAPGVVVTKVKGGGTAAVAGIRPLELILEVNGENVVSAKDFVEKTKGKKDLTFTVRRLTATRMVPIKL